MDKISHIVICTFRPRLFVATSFQVFYNHLKYFQVSNPTHISSKVPNIQTKPLRCQLLSLLQNGVGNAIECSKINDERFKMLILQHDGYNSYNQCLTKDWGGVGFIWLSGIDLRGKTRSKGIVNYSSGLDSFTLCKVSEYSKQVRIDSPQMVVP